MHFEMPMILFLIVFGIFDIKGSILGRLLMKRIFRNSQKLLSLKTEFTQYVKPVSQADLEFLPDNITDKSLFVTMKQRDILALAKLSQITSILSQRGNHVDLANVQQTVGHFNFKDNVYAADFVLKRGFGQLGGIVLTNQNVKKHDHIVSFAGTSSKWDILHALYLKDSIVIDDFGIHGGATHLSYENILFLERYIENQISKQDSSELLFTGHSLGGAIGILTLYLLKKRFAQSLDGKCVTFASPSPFKSSAAEKIAETIGYGNILNIIRDADYVHQIANLVGLRIVGPTIYLPSHNIDEDFDTHLKKIHRHIEKNHYIPQYIHDLECEEEQIWKEHEKVVQWYKIKSKIKKIESKMESDLRALEYLNNKWSD